MKKIVVTLGVVLLAGCADSRYPGWQSVLLAESVENKACEVKGQTELCPNQREKCQTWFKKRAVVFKANTVTSRYGYGKYTGRYYNCQAGLPPYKAPVFEATGYGVTGNAVTGQAFLTQVGGGVVTCAGNTVTMHPDQDYFNALDDDRSTGIVPEFEPSQEAQRYIHTTLCDAQGNFEFQAIPSGNWLISVEVSWGVPSLRHNFVGYYVKTSPQGGILRKAVTVQDAAVNKFIVTAN